MRAVVVGAAGMVGHEAAAALIRRAAFDEVTLVDRSAAALRARFGSRAPGVRYRGIDVTDAAALREVLRGADVMVNCTTYHLGIAMLRAAIAARTSYVDLGGLYNTPRQLALDDRARRAGITAVIGCGATPGITNVMVRAAADRLDRVATVALAFASFRDLAPSPGLLDTILDEFRPGVARFIWRRGALEPVEPFSGARAVRFPPPLGRLEVFYVPHSETHTLPRSLGDGLQEVSVRGTWRPEDMARLRAVMALGLTSDEPVAHDGTRIVPLRALRSVLLARPPKGPPEPKAFFLWAEVAGARDGRPATIVSTASHPLDWGDAATGRMTAIPAAIGAELVARGAVRATGVCAPEVAFEPEGFLRALAAEGIVVRRRG